MIGPLKEIFTIDDWLRKLRPGTSDIVVFQNVYNDEVISMLDPSFLPVDGRRNARTDIREFGLFLRMFHSGLYQSARLTGILSPQFNDKAKITGQQFLDFIAHNPGYNVYFVNPFPQNAYYTYNVWYHGDLAHAHSFKDLAEVLFDAAGYDTRVMYEARDSNKTLLYSSYWVGDAHFWNGYIAFITRLIETLEIIPVKICNLLLSNAYYYHWRTGESQSVSYLPFILERSFSTYLHMNPGMRGLAYPFTRQEILDHCYGGNFEREIVITFGDVIDEIDRRGEYNGYDRQVIFSLQALRKAAVSYRWL